jgi:site-specific DNA recombinase
MRDGKSDWTRFAKWLYGTNHIEISYSIDYEAVDIERKLLVDEAEAQIVKLIFERYRDLKSLPALQTDLRSRGIVSRVRKLTGDRCVGGIAFTNGPLAAMLRNRVFLGEINHRETSYPGEHAAIIERDLFDAVQQILDANRQGKRERRSSTDALLTGKLFDDRGNRMSPSYAIKKGVRYRYYVSCVLAQGRNDEAGTVARVSAMEIEQIVTEVLRRTPRAASQRSNEFSDVDMIRDSVDRVVVHRGSIEITTTRSECGEGDAGEFSQNIIRVNWGGPVRNPRREVLAPKGSDLSSAKPMRAQPRTKLIVAIAAARRWFDEVLAGTLDLEALARREGCSERHVRNTLSLAFLAPDIVRAAVGGHLPQGLGITRLADLPMDWTEQRRQIGI